MAGSFRTEKDSLGEVLVPKDALYGAQTQRALENFPVSGSRLPTDFIRAIVLIKKSAAQANSDLGLLQGQLADAIVAACDSLTEEDFDSQFPVDIYQTGSGTSSNMNVNEVLARIAARDSGLAVHPNDHVNMSQSSNDVIPSAIHVSALLAVRDHLLPALRHLHTAVGEKAAALEDVVKTGRTHLMDAVPMTLAQEIGAWGAQVESCRERIRGTLPRLAQLAQGGTAIGTGLNAHPDFAQRFAQKLSNNCGQQFRPADNLFAAIACQDTAVELSGQLKVLAVALMKIANDLRWMNSGPLAGLGEIELQALQPGSSIMPGKVNPVIAESVAMVAARVIGNDGTIALAGQSGNFQLNVMLPLVAHTLLESIRLLSSAARILADRAIAGFTVNRERIEQVLSRNPILVTALNPVIGYARAAEIAKEAYRSGRPVLDVALEMTDLDEETLRKLLDPVRLAQGGLIG
ncbi:class II fumarate hydratase [Microbulbifer thermotolerans]|uniref:class II fumarate hydratase n=1 Tax=Microbulbifer thermotolerans TaxID=252514 RepID=UPI00224877C8|nr:class II fumarate hydratase [Microbulbifer thermotolerans]MCX2779628.1 class II fumarate hydratase [Microbulbifer thermotolerans]MCX2782594.1 class II fumarate hydratase [Microbulbifer thermotolerans]MCX2794606.1 class II fumarate hydratase [Microbulbifer thermotolerans]MCX2804941.1 class II fumarate hydratase [Microbulbifer thermotolerans]MCX2841922.1 class II fumarate hydratase [Microbulbifer thermotolerans]